MLKMSRTYQFAKSKPSIIENEIFFCLITWFVFSEGLYHQKGNNTEIPTGVRSIMN